MSIKVENVKITPVTYKVDYSKYPKAVADQIKNVLPHINYYRMTFDIHAGTKLVNALRRTIIDEMEVKALDVDISDIDTNEEFIKLDEIRDRLSLLPLDQKIADKTFSIDVVNTKLQPHVVYSTGLGKGIPDKFRIARLRAGKYFRIPNIKVVKGYGFNHAKFSSGQAYFRCLDFIRVTFLEKRGCFITKMVKTTDLEAIMKKNKMKYTRAELLDFRVRKLIVSHKNNLAALNDRQKKQLDNYKYIINTPNELKSYQSSEVQPNYYAFTLETYGKWEPVEHMELCCQNIIDRLQTIKKVLTDKSDKSQTQNMVLVTPKEKYTEFFIRGETYTIGYLLRAAALQLNPKISNIKVNVEHSLNRTIKVSVIHPQAVKIMIDAIDKSVKDLEVVKKLGRK